MGKGSFVCGINSNTIKEQMIYEVQVILEEVITKANVAGISQKELIEMVQMLYE